MFSAKFKGVEGLEVDELDDLNSKAEDVRKAAEDVARLSTKKSNARGKKQLDQTKKKHDDALDNLVDLLQEWRIRPHVNGSTNGSIITRRGIPLQQDPPARHAVRKLHDHIQLRSNPIAAGDDEVWEAKLKELCRVVGSHLVEIANGDVAEATIWEPTTVDPSPLEDLQRYRDHPPSLSPEPMLGDMPDEEDEDEQLLEANDEGWRFYPNCVDGGAMGRVLYALELKRSQLHATKTSSETGEISDKTDGEADGSVKQDEEFLVNTTLPEHTVHLSREMKPLSEEEQCRTCNSCSSIKPKTEFRSGDRYCGSCREDMSESPQASMNSSPGAPETCVLCGNAAEDEAS